MNACKLFFAKIKIDAESLKAPLSTRFFDGNCRLRKIADMRTQLAPLIVVKQEFPDFRSSLLGSERDEENNNDFHIKSENDCNNNQPKDLNQYTRKSKTITSVMNDN